MKAVRSEASTDDATPVMAQQSRLRFGFVADCQLGCYASVSVMDPNRRTQLRRDGLTVPDLSPAHGFAWDLARLQRGIDQLRDYRDLAFVAVGGDMVQDARDEQQYQAVRDEFSRLHIPVHFAPGNHDVADDGVVPTPTSLARYRARYGPDSTSFAYGDVTGVIIDTTLLQRPEHLADEAAEQMRWMEQTLVDAHAAGHATIVFGHHPLCVTQVDEPDSFWNVPGHIRRTLFELFADCGVLAYFCGHLHRNVIVESTPVPVVVTAALGLPLGPDPSGIRIAELGPHGLSHRFVPLRGLEEPTVSVG